MRAGVEAHRRTLVVPAVTHLAVTLALLSWGHLTADPANYVGPAVLIGLVVAATGVAARRLRLPRAAVVVGQAVLGAMATSLAVCGSVLPLGAAAQARLVQEFEQAAQTVLTSEVPVLVAGPGVAPYLLVGAFGCYLLADVLATTLDRPPVAGLVLLAAVAVPLSVPGGRLSWVTFVVVATGYMLLVVVHEKDRVARWGRSLEAGGITATAGTQRRGLEAGAGVIGFSATVIALLLPTAIPTLGLDIGGFGEGGGDGDIEVTNPTVGMYEDLREQKPTELVTLRTDDPSAEPPQYLRIAALTSFDGRVWSPGNRVVPREQDADGRLRPPPGGAAVLGRETRYTLTATPSFESSWLPTFVHTTEIEADGDWRYDVDTLDFIAADDDLTTAGETWELTAAPLVPTKEDLLAATSNPGLVDNRLSASADLPPEIDQIAATRTAGYPTPFEKAVALQSWFRDSGEFVYSLDRPDTVTGSTGDDLVRFLTTDKVGYCQQYATAMAALARSLDIPARVAVGFLRPEQRDDGSYLFRASDLHAWPELWFDGIGWVMFDPTPPDVSGRAPAYTRGVLDGGADETEEQPGVAEPETTQGAQPSAQPNPREREPRAQAPVTETADGSGEDRTATAVAFVVLAGCVLVVLLLAAPALIRRRRRAARLAGGPEDGWAELRDTARDLGLRWSDDVSPRAAGRGLLRYVISPQGRESLERVVLAVERDRYARTPSGADVHDDVARAVAELHASAEPAAVRRARLWPRSVLARPPAEQPGSLREPVDQSS